MGNNSSSTNGGVGGGVPGGYGAQGQPMYSTSAALTKAQQQEQIRQQFDRLKNPVNNLLTRPKFHEALAVIETRGLKRLKETPLADLLFDSLAVSFPEALTLNEFSACITPVVCGTPQERADLTFQAFAGRNSSGVPISTVLRVVEQSWRLCCNLMAERRANRRKDASSADVTSLMGKFCDANISSMVDSVRAELEAMDSSGSHYVDHFNFMQWMREDRTVKLVVDSDAVEVPVSFEHILKPPAYPEVSPIAR